MALCICFFYFFFKHQQGIQKTPTEDQTPVLIDIVCSHRRRGRAFRQGRALLQTGVLKTHKKSQKKKKNFIQRSKIMKLFSVHSTILISSNYVVSNVTHQSGTVKKRTLSAGCQHPLSTPRGYPPLLQSPPWLWVHLQWNRQNKCSVSTLTNKLDRCGKSSSNSWATLKSKHDCSIFLWVLEKV